MVHQHRGVRVDLRVRIRLQRRVHNRRIQLDRGRVGAPVGNLDGLSWRDHPDRNGLVRHALDLDVVLTAHRVQADLRGVLGPERPVEVRRLHLLASPAVVLVDGDFHGAARLPLDPDFLVVSGAAHVHPIGKEAVVVARTLGQRIAPAAQRLLQIRAVFLVQRRREAMDRLRDDRVGELRHDLAGDCLPVFLVERHQEAPVGITPGERQLVDRGIARGESGELLGVVLGDGGNDAVESAERLVAVARDRLPEALAVLLEPGPAPLEDVPIPVSHEDVDQPGAQVGARVHPLVAPVLEPVEEGQRVRNHGRFLEPALDPLLQEPEHAGVLVELAEAWIVGQDRELRRRMEDAGRVEQRWDHQRAVGLRGARLVLEEVADPGVARVGVERAARLLVDRSERPGVAVAALEVQVDRLHSPREAIRAEPSVEGIQIEQRHLDWGGPRVAPVLA